MTSWTTAPLHSEVCQTPRLEQEDHLTSWSSVERDKKDTLTPTTEFTAPKFHLWVASNCILIKYTRDVAQAAVKSWTAGTLLIFDFTAVSSC